MDYTNTLPQIIEGSNAVVAINENFASASPAMVFAFDPTGSAGLIWAYWGGRWGGNIVLSDNETLGASTTTYMVVARATGVVSFSTSTTNWNNDTDYCRAYKITTSGSSITDYEDHRAGPGGANFGGGAGGGGGVGDFVGPSSSVASEIVLFDGTTGKLGKRATGTGYAKVTSGVLSADSSSTVSADLQGAGLTAGAVGFRIIPQNSQSTAYTTVSADSGKHIFHPAADTTARTFTIDSNANVAYPIGTALTFVNENGAGVVTIAITSDTMRLAGAGTTGSRTLAANGIATALKVGSTSWLISGTGLT